MKQLLAHLLPRSKSLSATSRQTVPVLKLANEMPPFADGVRQSESWTQPVFGLLRRLDWLSPGFSIRSGPEIENAGWQHHFPQFASVATGGLLVGTWTMPLRFCDQIPAWRSALRNTQLENARSYNDSTSSCSPLSRKRPRQSHETWALQLQVIHRLALSQP